MARFGRVLSRAIRRGFGQAEEVEVSEIDGVRALFLGSETMQSAMRVKAPFELELTYSRAMMLFLLFAGNARQVLMIGLGGGSVAKYIHHFLPEICSRVVEINPRIIEVAHSHFYLPENDARLEVIEADGVAYLQQNANTTEVLLLDVFDGQGETPDMYNQAFFDSCVEVLTLDGMMAINLWGSDKNFDIYLQRIEQSFNQRVLVLRTGRPGNIVVFAFKRLPKELRWASLREQAKLLEQDHKIEFLEFVEKLRDQNPSTNHRLLLGE